MGSLTNCASEVEWEKSRQWTYDAIFRNVKSGHVTGGKMYGYANVEILPPTLGPDGRRKRLHLVRRINPDQAGRKSN